MLRRRGRTRRGEGLLISAVSMADRQTQSASRIEQAVIAGNLLTALAGRKGTLRDPLVGVESGPQHLHFMKPAVPCVGSSGVGSYRFALATPGLFPKGGSPMTIQSEVELTPEETRELVDACRQFNIVAKGELLLARDEIKALKAKIARLEMKLYPVIEETHCGR